jgi:hypothetical protein
VFRIRLSPLNTEVFGDHNAVKFGFEWWIWQNLDLEKGKDGGGDDDVFEHATESE